MGSSVGLGVRSSVGLGVGSSVGFVVGSSVGSGVGSSVGSGMGSPVGSEVGLAVESGVVEVHSVGPGVEILVGTGKKRPNLETYLFPLIEIDYLGRGG